MLNRDWAGRLEIVIAGEARLPSRPWRGGALLKWLGIETRFVRRSESEKRDDQLVPDGQERLATQSERDEVNERIDGAHPEPAGGAA